LQDLLRRSQTGGVGDLIKSSSGSLPSGSADARESHFGALTSRRKAQSTVVLVLLAAQKVVMFLQLVDDLAFANGFHLGVYIFVEALPWSDSTVGTLYFEHAACMSRRFALFATYLRQHIVKPRLVARSALPTIQLWTFVGRSLRLSFVLDVLVSNFNW